MAWIGPAIGAGAGILGSLTGPSAPSSAVPRKDTRRQIRRYLPQLESLYTGAGPAYPTTDPVTGLNPNEQSAIGGLEQLGGSYLPGLSEYYSQLIQGGAGGNNGPLGSYAEGGLPFLNAAALTASQGPPQVQAGQIGINPMTGQPGRSANDFLTGAPQIDPSAFMGAFGANPTSALNSMLSGQVDTTQFNSALGAAFDPMIRNFQERILPSVLQADDAYTGGQGGSGKTKISQRLGEDLTNQMSEVSGRMGYQAYNDAQGRQTGAANLLTGMAGDLSGRQGGLNAGYQGLGAGISQGYDTMGQQANQFIDQLGFNTQSANVGNNMMADFGNQDAYFNFLGNMLQGSNQGAYAANAYGGQMLDYTSQVPNIANMAMMGPQALAAAGGAQRTVADAQAGNQFNREQYTNQLPFMQAQDYMSMMTSLAGSAGSGQRSYQPSPYAPIGMGIAELINNWPQAQQGQTTRAGSDQAIEDAIKLSDIRLKEQIIPSGKIGSHNAYEWTWNDKANELGLYGRARGVIADEVLHTQPEVVTTLDGYLAVDYGRLI